jgi:tetratricopeptide (TPR) repeat protein
MSQITAPKSKWELSAVPHSVAMPDTGVRFQSTVGALNGLLVILLLALAFLMAASPVRNSDFWMHLATGREMAQQRYEFGKDPFSYTTAGVYWTNHSWLFDWVLYESFRLLGGTGIVILKGSLMAALAGLLISIRKPNELLWLPLILTTLVFAVMTPRLLLQPALVSFLLLGLALFLLWKGRWLWLLPLCVLWVNVDSWFWLGPILVALFWVGQRFSKSERTIPTWLAPACLLGCLLNPHHVHALLTPPAELSLVAAKSGFSHDVRFERAFVSPWQQHGLLSNPAGICYFVLFGVSLLSLLLNRKAWRDWRLPVWLAFAGLGAWQLRTVPFFAIVAGPIAALNFQELLERLPARSNSSRRYGALAVTGRFLLALGLVGVGVVAWTGWLQNLNSRSRAVGLSVEPDSSLQHVAETISQWRKQQTLPAESRGFALHPDVANYCAWFCPEEQGFFDYRLNLFGTVAGEYESTCRQLLPGLAEEVSSNSHSNWQQVFHEHHIDHVILYDSDPARLRDAFDRMSRASQSWRMLSVSGQAIVFGWVSGQSSATFSRFPTAEDEASREAYGPEIEGAHNTLAMVPSVVAKSTPKIDDAWSAFRKGRRASWESMAADICLRNYDNRAALDYTEIRNRAHSGYYAGLIGSAAPGPAIVMPASNIVFREYLRVIGSPVLFGDSIGRPAEWPLLAVRACRRALLANPDDANAYLRLGQAYLALRDTTAEGNQQVPFAALHSIRHIQAVTALKQALIRNADLLAAHEHLAVLFEQSGNLDAALEHRVQQLRLIRAAGPKPAESTDQFEKRVQQFERAVHDFERLVQDRQKQFAIRAASLSGESLGKAQLAVSFGLAKQALDEILLKSRIELFGTAGARLQLELMLNLGRAEDVHALLADPEIQEHRFRMGVFSVPLASWNDDGAVHEFPAYDWFHACQALALGDYDTAVSDFDSCAALYREAESRLLPQIRTATASTVGNTVAAKAHAGALGFQFQMEENRMNISSKLRQTLLLRNQLADVFALQGMALLERGPGASAEDRFRQSLNVILLDGRQTKTAGQLLSWHYWKRIHESSSGGQP